MQLAGISAKNHPKAVVVDTGILVLVSMISTSPILRMTTAKEVLLLAFGIALKVLTPWLQVNPQKHPQRCLPSQHLILGRSLAS